MCEFSCELRRRWAPPQPFFLIASGRTPTLFLNCVLRSSFCEVSPRWRERRWAASGPTPTLFSEVDTRRIRIAFLCFNQQDKSSENPDYGEEVYRFAVRTRSSCAAGARPRSSGWGLLRATALRRHRLRKSNSSSNMGNRLALSSRAVVKVGGDGAASASASICFRADATFMLSRPQNHRSLGEADARRRRSGRRAARGVLVSRRLAVGPPHPNYTYTTRRRAHMGAMYTRSTSSLSEGPRPSLGEEYRGLVRVLVVVVYS